MYYISSVQKEYIEMALTTIDENYGGMDKFLVQQWGWMWRNFVSCICIRIRCFCVETGSNMNLFFIHSVSCIPPDVCDKLR